ncbi:MAG TPA: ABC transporter permease [Dehalococcoidia bacterium]|nr:ABC transporter permease [Dehalococcoidia bacterium]
MQRYIAGRLLLLPPTLIGVSLIIFVIMRLLPGDVVEIVLGTAQGVTEQQKVELRHNLGLDRPLPVQYAQWVGGLARLDTGRSLFTKAPISAELKDRLPVTAELALGAVLLSTLIALPVGIISAVFQDRAPDYFLRIFSILGLALPIFWIQSLVRNLILPKYFGWVPPPGYAEPWHDLGTNLQQMWMPVLLLGYVQSAIISRLTRSTMLDVLREDYIRTARAKGLRERGVILRHATRNAMLPVVTLATIQLGTLLGGAVITESVFGLPGVGRYVLDAIRNRDYPVVEAVIVMIAMTYALLNLVVDLLYGWIDPRIRLTV